MIRFVAMMVERLHKIACTHGAWVPAFAGTTGRMV
jgi:hypothetical protein